MDLDLARHKEFRFCRDGAYVAVGTWHLGRNTKPAVCVIRVADGRRSEVTEVSYDFGGRRLDIDPETHTLFSGAYHRTGIAAYDFESGRALWVRRDVKKLGQVAYDALEDVLYCLCERRTVLLTASSGKERAYHRGLTSVFFGKDPRLAVFDAADVRLQNRATQAVHVLPKATGSILRVAFTGTAAVLSWVSGPVTAYGLESGELLWTYKPEGTHAYAIAPSSDNASVWVAEQPFKAPPWHRLRLLSSAGEIKQEVRCGLGHSFEIAPHADSVIRGDTVLTPIATRPRRPRPTLVHHRLANRYAVDGGLGQPASASPPGTRHPPSGRTAAIADQADDRRPNPDADPTRAKSTRAPPPDVLDRSNRKNPGIPKK